MQSTAQAYLTPRERMFRALRGEKADVVPAAPAYLSLYLADLERAGYIEQYRRRVQGSRRCPVDHREDTLFRAQALYQSYGIFQARPDWIEVHTGATRAWAERTAIVLGDDGRLYYEDQASGLRVAMDAVPLPRGDAILAPPNPSLSDLWDGSGELDGPADVDRRLPIRSASELLARGDFDLPRQVLADCGDRYFISTVLDTPFSDAYNLLGFQGLMVIQHDRPALLHHLLARQLAQTQEVMAAWAAIGLHGVYVEEVFTGADILSPASYDEYVLAYNRPYFRRMRALGLLPIYYLCGDVVPRLQRMCELDVAAVAVEESKKSFRIEIAKVVEAVGGRVAVFGNIDTVRFGLHGTVEEMAAEVRRQAAIGVRARGFVVSTGSPFPLGTSPRLIDALVATAHALAA